MNERFAADPDCFDSHRDLKALLDRFGVFTGRYLLLYPNDWESRLAKLNSTLSPLESSRVSTILRRAKENAALIKMPSLMWVDKLSWRENATKLTRLTPPKLDRLILASEEGNLPIKSSHFDEIDLPPTAEERIHSTPEEYTRVSHFLMLLSHEINLVDPYLNPCNIFYSTVLDALLKVLASTNSKCNTISIHARAKNVLTDGNSIKSITTQLEKMYSSAQPEKPLKIMYHLIDDSVSKDRMHDRYLFSVKGGIQLSQGFQQLRRSARITVAPLSQSIHKEIWNTYVDKKTDMTIVKTISIS